MIQNNIENLDKVQSLALKTAWQRYVQMKTNASAASRQYLKLRSFSIALTVVATLLAVLTSQINPGTSLGEVLKACLILFPIASVIIWVFANKLQQGEYWRVLSTGAEEIKKEIYLYRTLLQGQDARHQWLSERVTAIQRQVIESIGGNLALSSHTEEIPPTDSPEGQNGDSGFSDLLADDYLCYRLEPQLKWHSQEIERLHTTRTRLQIGIFTLAGLSAVVAGLGSSLSIWVALTTAIGTALTLWLEVNRLDSVVNNYNQLTLELNLIRDRWQSLSFPERTGEEFFKLVIATEKVLWSQHNQHITQMRQAVTDLHAQTSDLLTQVLKSPVPSTIYPVLLPQNQTPVETVLTEAEVLPAKAAQKAKEEQKKQSQKGLPHAFVVMPFGRKKGPDGRWIDFNSIYYQLIKPTLEEAGFEPFRADEEAVSGDILTDMFQELLLADLVLADLSIDNANVFYELGVRHAIRKRGLVHIQCGRAYMPYDIFNVRTIPYHCDENGCPDPQHIEKDKQAIIKVARATWESDGNRIHSPIFNLLTGLEEPDRKALRTPLATGYWQEYKELQARVKIAQRQKRIGDVLLLTEEVRNPLIKEEVIADAGKVLTGLENYALALKEYRQGLKINPYNSEFRRQEAFNLSRLKQSDEAIVKLEGLLQDEPNNIEAICNLAHIYKEKWRDEWVNIPDEQERLQAAYESAHLLTKSIQTYLKAYRFDQNHFYPASNALMLLAVLDHLGQQLGTDSDPEEQALRQQLPSLKGALQFCLESATQRDSNDYWAFVSLGDWAVCISGDPKQVMKAYKKAFTLAGKNKFALKSTLEQLQVLHKLSFRPEYVQAGITTIQAELNRFEGQKAAIADHTSLEPSQVFLFCGHMIDSPKREEPRFPAAMESEARQRIEAVLERLNPYSKCLAIAPGAACGGDILFIEACLRRNMNVEIFLPFYQPEFIQDSVSFAGEDWVSRFYAIQNHPNVTIHLQPDRLGDVPEGDNAYERNNRWVLYSTLMYGIDRVRLVVLWDGKGGDAPGGTGDMVQQVRQLGGIVEHIDTTKFDYWKINEKVVDFPKPLEMTSQAQES
ncbi:MAG TPA: SLATT domain-containing protein [Waterburya sp.]|jgi:tetratricopeptide (TPR) repeat protein